MIEIAARLALIRRAEKLGARPFAERVGKAGYPVTYASVLAYEADGGTEKVPAAYCVAVARAFGLSVEYVLGLRDERAVVPPTEAQKRLRNIAREIREAERAGVLYGDLTPADDSADEADG